MQRRVLAVVLRRVAEIEAREGPLAADAALDGVFRILRG